MKKRNTRNPQTDATINRRPTDRERYLEIQLEATQADLSGTTEELNSARAETARLRQELEQAQTEASQLRKDLDGTKATAAEWQASVSAMQKSVTEAEIKAETEQERSASWRNRFFLLLGGVVVGVLMALWLGVYRDYQEGFTPLAQVVTTTESEDLAIRGLCQALYNEVNYDLARALILKMNKEKKLFVIRDEEAFGKAYLETRWLREAELWLWQNFQGYYQYTSDGRRYTVLVKKPRPAAVKTSPEPAPNAHTDDDSLWATPEHGYIPEIDGEF